MAARRALLAAAVAALLASPLAPAGDLGTLFYTPQERERLDRLRRGEPVAEAEGEAAASGMPRVNGYLKRSDGRDTVFLDGRAYPAAGPKAATQPKRATPGPATQTEPKPKG